MNEQNVPATWPELAVSLYDKLTGRNSEICYHFENFEVDVPDRVGEGGQTARWRLNGTLKITTNDLS